MAMRTPTVAESSASVTLARPITACEMTPDRARTFDAARHENTRHKFGLHPVESPAAEQHYHDADREKCDANRISNPFECTYARMACIYSLIRAVIDDQLRKAEELRDRTTVSGAPASLRTCQCPRAKSTSEAMQETSARVLGGRAPLTPCSRAHTRAAYTDLRQMSGARCAWYIGC